MYAIDITGAYLHTDSDKSNYDTAGNTRRYIGEYRP